MLLPTRTGAGGFMRSKGGVRLARKRVPAKQVDANITFETKTTYMVGTDFDEAPVLSQEIDYYHMDLKSWWDEAIPMGLNLEGYTVEGQYEHEVDMPQDVSVTIPAVISNSIVITPSRLHYVYENVYNDNGFRETVQSGEVAKKTTAVQSLHPWTWYLYDSEDNFLCIVSTDANDDDVTASCEKKTFTITPASAGKVKIHVVVSTFSGDKGFTQRAKLSIGGISKVYEHGASFPAGAPDVIEVATGGSPIEGTIEIECEEADPVPTVEKSVIYKARDAGTTMGVWQCRFGGCSANGKVYFPPHTYNITHPPMSPGAVQPIYDDLCTWCSADAEGAADISGLPNLEIEYKGALMYRNDGRMSLAISIQAPPP